MTARALCRACGASLRRTARYCPGCGRELPQARAQESARLRAERREDARVTAGVALTFAATLAALLLVPWLAERWQLAEDGAGFVALHGLALAAAGALAILALGPSTWRASFGHAPAPRWWGVAPLVGAATFGMAWGYATLLGAFSAGVEPEELLEPTAPTCASLVLVLLVAPLLEEWVDRGVLWTACLKAGGVSMALWTTSALFALSHGLNGGYVLELPHRFLGGLALGWLRWRSGSLAAPILAHFTWNALATWVA